MGGLPSGTVTMLFSDIEESTSLLSRLGDDYVDALDAHRSLLRTAFSAGGGRELGTEGDSFFVVFESAGEAVRTCAAAQRALSSHEWPNGESVRVRMGLHSGEPVLHDGGYVGMDVHRAARIAAAAHGGQVVISDATWHLVQSRLPADVSVHDLGWHRLKGIEEPERIYQLVAAGLPDRFPPLKTLGAQTRLPVPLTPLVGREGELAELRAQVLGEGVRLVTLTGTGGVGKTRLALGAASSLDDAFPEGVFFVALETIRDAEVMWKAIAEDLDVGSDQPASAAVADHLRDRRSLLVLDNLEQLDGAAGVAAALLAAAPHLVVLATSRRPLHLPGEHEHPVPPLEVPSVASAAEVADSGAVRLFVQQAQMVKPSFTLTERDAGNVVAICARLDGLPMAIELAASRIRLLTPAALLARLGTSLDLAAAAVGRPSRQHTLRSTIAWSCDLLTPELEGVFCRAGVFAGGCDLDALEAVALADMRPEPVSDPLEPVAELVDVSLITAAEGAGGEPRIGILQTIREFALERLRLSDELDATQGRHAEYYASFAEQMSRQLRGPAQLATMDRLEMEHDNLRSALRWSLETQSPDSAVSQERAAIGLRLVQALGPFWYQHGHATEGRHWLQMAIELASDDAGARLARVTHWFGVLLQQQGENTTALPLFERSLAIWRRLDDKEQVARELNSLGITHRHLGHLEMARTLLEDSVSITRDLDGSVMLPAALTNLGQMESAAGNADRATQVLREALSLDRARGDMVGVTIDQQSLAAACLRAGRGLEALSILRSICDDVVSSGDCELLASTLELSAATVASLQGGLLAARLAGAAEGVRDTCGMPIPAADRALLDKFLRPASAAFERSSWEAELTAGRALSDQQAIALVALPVAGR
ncbi:MAG TPA: tetratricopeptide repeat protein [Streptosporangiaceae bacterium]|nr:tetratricopeptide repeat protein [Streptosporangiaceae bacterium]